MADGQEGMKGPRRGQEPVRAHLLGFGRVQGGVTGACFPRNVVKTKGTASAKQLGMLGQSHGEKNSCVSFLKQHFKNRLVCEAKQKNRLASEDVLGPREA